LSNFSAITWREQVAFIEMVMISDLPGTPASSTTKIGRHDISESGIKHQKSNQIKSFNKI
jgi:hypothetical protein